MTTETLITAETTTEGNAADPETPPVVTHGQPAEGIKTEGEQQEKKPEGAPESYDFKAPEGVQFDDTVIGAFAEVAKELNLPQDQAQKVLDKMAPVIAARQLERFETARNDWAEAAKSDKEFGGAKLAENLSLAKKALDTFATAELRELLDQSGLGNHPEVIRMFYRTGKAISEDRFVGGKRDQQAQQTVAQRMYPNMNP
jgi:hypothetical protein